MTDQNKSIILWALLTVEKVKEMLQNDSRIIHSARFYISSFYLSDWTSHPRKDDTGRYWIDGKLYGKDPQGRINPGKYKDLVFSELKRILYNLEQKEIEDIFSKFFYLDY